MSLVTSAPTGFESGSSFIAMMTAPINAAVSSSR